MIKPFIKWVGGKRQLINDIKKYMPKKYNRYIEPFIGGGALFFELTPKNAIINDKNLDLIDTYRIIKNKPKKLIKILLKHKKKNTKEYFLEIRSWDKSNRYWTRKPENRAARFIYLNKTCFNGMYRVNASGEFNVPYGKYKKPSIFEEENITAVSKLLKNTEIYNSDFAEIAHMAKKGDFVYFDPPYVPLSKTESFVSYTKDGFGKLEQLRLKRVIDELTEKKVYVMLSNSAADWIYETYKDYNIHTVNAKRMINSNAKRRGNCKEVIITNY